MTERDDTRRRELLIYLDILDRLTGEQVGRLGDISSDGMMIMSSNPIAPGQSLSLSIQVPAHLELGCLQIAVDVETRWCKPDSNPRIHCTGCLFINLSDAQRRRIRRIERQLGSY